MEKSASKMLIDAETYANMFHELVEYRRKAEKYKVHDLRKNPDDLPTEDGYYLVKLFGKPIDHTMTEDSQIVAKYQKGSWTIHDGSFGDFDMNEDILAWREIESFEEEE